METEAHAKTMRRLRCILVVCYSLWISAQAIKLVAGLISWVTALWLLLVAVVSTALMWAWYVFGVHLHKRGSKWLPAYVLVYVLAGILLSMLVIWHTFLRG